MNRRTFTKILIVAGAAFGINVGSRKHGRVNVQEHGGRWRVWINNKEVTRNVFEADDRAGYALCCKRNSRDRFYLETSHVVGCAGGMVRTFETSHRGCGIEVAQERLTGAVRIERT